ncbi:phosphotransferase [Natronoglomus mannanivorans]|uniref:Phosphotransferase n=1 Tax=Natronoglomus mannanivorans TaxID=2979990 RepID=A0AAP3DZU8_9EURY|nr:phosphotransferase [Halobacteria archaeon AArc-xg1-1]
MSVDQILAKLREFDAYIDHQGSGSARYMFIDGGRYKYLCNLDHPSFRPSYIADDGLETIALHTTLWIARRSLNVAKMLPKIDAVYVRFENIEPPDLVVQRHRTKMIDVDDGKVYTLGDDSIHREYQIQQKIPIEINKPSLLEYDPDYPYLIEEFIRGVHPTRSVDDWIWFDRALQELRPLHSSNGSNRLATEKLLAEIPDKDPVISRALRMVDRYPVPTHLTKGKVHGDLAHKNILVSDGEPYILDWDSTRDDLVCCDLFYPILDFCREKQSPKLFKQMIFKGGKGYGILHQSSDFIQFAMDEYKPGLPLVYLLHRIHRETPLDPTSDKAYPILEMLVNCLEKR